MWKPTLSISTETDTAKKAKEDKQFEFEYKAEYNAYIKHRIYWELVQCV